jgi:glutamine synthetase
MALAAEGLVSDEGLIYLLWSDLVGVTRTRGIPLRAYERRLEAGLGWANAGQAMTPFEHLADNPWGPVHEVRQIPDPETRFTIPASAGDPALHAVICDSRPMLGADWSCCTRTFLRNALADFEAETGLGVVAAFELEFLLEGEGFEPESPFSFDAAAAQHSFLTEIEAACTEAGAPPETVEPEYGRGQYEVSCEPRPALRAADAALVTRETIRTIARRRGLRASFTPKPTPSHVGNGCHIHMSFSNKDGRNVTHDPAGSLGLSDIARQFGAGLLAHMDALLAITAPSPISYLRLGPHKWSTGYRSIGVQNREAAVRIMPGHATDPAAAAAAVNLEFRAADCTASPYLALGMLIRAGLDGIRRSLPVEAVVEVDPADMTEEARSAAGITELPATLRKSLAAFADDPVARGWFSDELYQAYTSIKSWEAEFAETVASDRVLSQYRAAY